MSAVPNTPRFANAQAYLAWEAWQPERHEDAGGEIYGMTGAAASHNTITFNACASLRPLRKGIGCRTYGMGVKLHSTAKGDVLDPGLMVTCDPRDRQPGDDRGISHPWLVTEVLSDTTPACDRGHKFQPYRSISTLTHDLLIEQTRPYAGLFFKNADAPWGLQPLQADDAIQIDRLGQPWPVASLLEDVDFTPPSAPSPPPAA